MNFLTEDTGGPWLCTLIGYIIIRYICPTEMTAMHLSMHADILFKPSVRMGKKIDLVDAECSLVDVSVFQRVTIFLHDHLES